MCFDLNKIIASEDLKPDEIDKFMEKNGHLM